MSSVTLFQTINILKFNEEIQEVAVENAAALIERDAKLFARKDTSTLTRDIEREVRRKKGFVYSDLDYATSQEFGLPNQPSQKKDTLAPKNGAGGPYTFTPFFRPATKNTARLINTNPRLIKKIGNEAIRRSTERKVQQL